MTWAVVATSMMSVTSSSTPCTPSPPHPFIVVRLGTNGVTVVLSTPSPEGPAAAATARFLFFYYNNHPFEL
jgi:hypothetical protein